MNIIHLSSLLYIYSVLRCTLNVRIIDFIWLHEITKQGKGGLKPESLWLNVFIYLKCINSGVV